MTAVVVAAGGCAVVGATVGDSVVVVGACVVVG